MIQKLRNHRQACILLGTVLLLLAVVCMFGRVTFRNELTRDVREHVFLGYLDEKQYGNTVEISSQNLPDWCAVTQADLRAMAEEKDEKDAAVKSNGAASDSVTYVVTCTEETPRIGIYADVTGLELRVEDRRWLDGKLMVRNREYYYKVRDHVSLEPCADGMTAEIAPDDIRRADYGGIRYQND